MHRVGEQSSQALCPIGRDTRMDVVSLKILAGLVTVLKLKGAQKTVITRVRNLAIFNYYLKIKIFVLFYKSKCNLIKIFNFCDNYF